MSFALMPFLMSMLPMLNAEVDGLLKSLSSFGLAFGEDWEKRLMWQLRRSFVG